MTGNQKTIQLGGFSESDLYWLSLPYPVRISRRIREKKMDEAVRLCEDMKASQILLHDFFADSCAVMWSWVGTTMGEGAMEPMFRYIFSHSAKRQYFDAARAQTMPHLTVDLLARSWRAHCCFGAGAHPGSFSITEDDEKFTLHLHPCASGARLWRKGRYEPGQGGRLSEKRHPWTYQRIGFPYYCIHCAFLNEILPYESAYGFLLWPVDPLLHKDDGCAWHVYKDPALIPDRYYRRLGLTPPPKKSRKNLPVPGHRFFTKRELADMAKPMPDRIIISINSGSYENALRLCREIRGEFLALHDLYVMMIVSTLTFIAGSQGEESLGDLLELQYRKCIEETVLAETDMQSTHAQVTFLANMIFSTDNCNRTGYHSGKFKIIQDDRNISFVLDPCGSGGRLRRAGSYQAMPFIKRLQEQAENSLAYYAVHLPLPAKLLKMIFPFTVNHFTQRKPYNQGRTKRPHAWSFNKSNTPFYCCQCGMIQEKLSGCGLTIHPPQRDTDPCIWKLKKNRQQKGSSPCPTKQTPDVRNRCSKKPETSPFPSGEN